MPGGVNQVANQLGSPQWAGDFGGREHILPAPLRVDHTLFTDGLGVSIVVDSAGALANATSVPVTPALTVALPAGTTLSFGSSGSKKFAKLSADAAIGATSLTVEALPTALVSGDTAIYSKYGRKSLKSGTFIGRTTAERLAGTSFGPASASDDEVYLVMFDSPDLISNPEVEGYRPGGLVKENYLPEWSTLNTSVNEVQTVALAGTLSGGQFKVGAILSDGTEKWSEDIAYNANLAAIQAGYDTVFGSSKVVIAGTVASHTVTFSGTDYSGTGQPPIRVDANEVTGITSVTVTETTKGGKAILEKLRSVYQCIQGAN